MMFEGYTGSWFGGVPFVLPTLQLGARQEAMIAVPPGCRGVTVPEVLIVAFAGDREDHVRSGVDWAIVSSYPCRSVRVGVIAIAVPPLVVLKVVFVLALPT